MLPGVELARRRRVHHHHEIQARGSPDPSGTRPPPGLQPTAMDESALVALRRLQEKLGRRLAGSPPSSMTTRWSRPAVDEGRSSGRGPPAVVGGSSELRRTSIVRGDSTADLCAVCLEEMVGRRRVMRLPCSHAYHSDCLLPWLAAHSHCPCCRTLVPSLHPLS